MYSCIVVPYSIKSLCILIAYVIWICNNKKKENEDNHKEKPEKEFIQSEEERARIDGLYECVLCACCSSACPSYWWNPDKFAGPAALLWACRFIVDTRDQGREERLAELKGLYRLYRCRVIMNCVSVCPKSLNPTKAIMQLHEEMVRGASKQTAVEDH